LGGTIGCAAAILINKSAVSLNNAPRLPYKEKTSPVCPASLITPPTPKGFDTVFRVLSQQWVVPGLCSCFLFVGEVQGEEPPRQAYLNRLGLITRPAPLLADHPEFVEPIKEMTRYEAPPLVQDAHADLSVRAWRFSYNARGIIEIPNALRSDRTAIIVVHPWAIDDGQGWRTPEPAGVAFACTPAKNRVCLDHMARVVQPFLKSLRGKVGIVAYSLPGSEDAIRKKLYRSIRSRPSEENRLQGAKELRTKLQGFPYRGEPLHQQLNLSADKPVVDYFRQFPGLDATAPFNGEGFWDLPIPVAKPLEVARDDVVIYDGEGYPPLKKFLQQQGIRHILLAGYHADMCVCQTTAGYRNLARDFNVFLVGDATQATFPASDTPRFATSATISSASLEVLITQISWIHYRAAPETKDGWDRTPR
jgi:nicotinamidase-related amidase